MRSKKIQIKKTTYNSKWHIIVIKNKTLSRANLMAVKDFWHKLTNAWTCYTTLWPRVRTPAWYDISGCFYRHSHWYIGYSNNITPCRSLITTNLKDVYCTAFVYIPGLPNFIYLSWQLAHKYAIVRIYLVQHKIIICFTCGFSNANCAGLKNRIVKGVF